jgi:hypothetical protein
MKLWVTKYALTSGIMEIDGEVSGDLALWEVNGWNQYVHGEGKEWHRTFSGASNHAEKMRIKKIASHKNSIAKLEKLRFQITANEEGKIA